MKYDYQDFETSQGSQNRKKGPKASKVNEQKNFKGNHSKLNTSLGVNEQKSKLDLSNIFDKETSFLTVQPNYEDHNQSRNILQISYNKSKENMNGSFRFQKEVEVKPNNDNARYSHIQKLLNKQKYSSFDNLHRKDDSSRKPAQVEYSLKNKQQFKNLISSIKEEKRKQQKKIKSDDSLKQNQPEKKSKVRPYDSRFESPVFDFSKKKQSNCFLSSDFMDENFDEIQEDEPPKPQEFDGVKQARQFFDSSGPSTLKKKESSKKPKKQSIPLDVIREEKATIFEKTIQQEKLNMLINNYEGLKSNFDDLMTELKQPNDIQQKIVDEFEIIKKQLKNKQSFAKDKKKFQRNLSIQLKKEKFNEIKEQINKIKQSNKDLIISKISYKLQTLQSAVKLAFSQIAEQKQQPSFEKSNREINQKHERQQLRALNFRKQPSQESLMEKRRRQKYQRKTIKSKNQYDQGQDLSRSQVVEPYDFVTLQKQDFQEDEIQFIPASFAKQYFPIRLDSNNSVIRQSLTEKQFLICQNSEFKIFSKFQQLDEIQYPLMAEITVVNKCNYRLNDLLVIVYGSHGYSPLIKPSNVYLEHFNPQSSFNIQIFFNKDFLNDNSFFLQLTYKPNLQSRKKMNIKGIIPIFQIIRPQFVQEYQFTQLWDILQNQLYIGPRTLDFMHIRSHQDIKLILPFTSISQEDPNIFCYGLVFEYKTDAVFLLKLYCFINGKASVHLRTDRITDQKVNHEILDLMNTLLFSL